MTNDEILDLLKRKANPTAISVMLNESGSDVKNWIANKEYMMEEYEFDPEEFLSLLPEFTIEKTGRDRLDPEKTQIVLYFQDNDMHIAVDGYYSSYESDDYCDNSWYIAKREIVQIEKFTKKN